jgi:hypothetical protein
MPKVIACVLLASLACSAPPRRVWTAGAPARSDSAIIDPFAEEAPRLLNLRLAAQFPWTDDGACAARESAGEWKTLIERCYHALDLSRIRFRDPDHRCALASTEAIAVGQVVGICLLVQPQLALAAVVIVGAVVVAAYIAAELAKAENCDDWFTACLGTKIASIPGPLYGHSQCHACRDLCVQLGGAWPASANGKPCQW